MTVDKSKVFERPLERRQVPAPEYGEGAYFLVRELTGEERNEYNMSLWQQSKRSVKLKMDHATAKLVVLGTINEDGSKYFGDDEVLTVSRKIGSKILERLAAAINELSGITEDEIEELTETKK